MARDYRLLIGASGWSHTGWRAEFYPEDLPADWQLGYYANEFPVVLVTEREWALPDADAGHWCEDTDSSFRFVAEITASPEAAIPQQLNRLAGFGARCSGVILCAAANSDLTAIKTLVDVIDDTWPVCIDFGKAGPPGDVRQWLGKQKIGWCWHGVGTAEGLQQGTLAVTRIHIQPDDPYQVRRWVETALASSTEHRQAILLFEGHPPAMTVMRQAQVILDLL